MEKQIKENDLKYLIKGRTAEIIGYYAQPINLLIPRSIKHDSAEYIVQSITAIRNAEYIKSIQFPPDSELQAIGERAFSGSSFESINIPPHVTNICAGAFYWCGHLKRIDIPPNSKLESFEKDIFNGTSIESLFIPASVTELKEGWCCCTTKLTKINVDERNPRYLNYEGKMILCKRSEKSENFDKIVFVRRDIKEFTVPSFVKVIGSYAFEYCSQLRRIEFPPNSELQTIEKRAFSHIPIESINIPPHVTKICAGAFCWCSELRRIDIPPNSELQIIEKEAFKDTLIESLFIPASVTELKEGWCRYTSKLTKINIDERNPRYLNYEGKMILCKRSGKSENFDKIVFVRRDIKEFTVPSFVTIIGTGAFEYCSQLRRIEFPPNSELQTIVECIFTGVPIESIVIPPRVTKICKSAFIDCRQLKIIEIDEKSEKKSLYKVLYKGINQTFYSRDAIIMIPAEHIRAFH